MRVTEGRLDLAASHTTTAQIEGHRQVQAWDQTGRVELTDDVKVTISSASAELRAGDLARGMAKRLADGTDGRPGLGLGRDGGVRAHGAPAFGLSPAQAARTGTAAAPAPAEAPDGDPTLDSTDVDQQAWLLLLRMTGDEEAAAELAQRLAAFARRMQGAGDLAQVLERVAAQYANGAATRSGGTSGQAPAQGWGYREDVSVTVSETEATSFAAAATVRTADGRTIDVAAAFDLVRSETTTVSASVRRGDALKDPLVLQLGGAAPSVGTGTQQVDVDADGTAETVAALAPGTAYLVRDANGNGIVDDGSELFGPATDDGFAELAALDEDGSGWVDEGDAAFGQLALWTGAQGAALVSLAEAGVGALAADWIATPYAYGSSTGVLAASSIFLYEDGRAGIAGELKLYA